MATIKGPGIIGLPAETKEPGKRVDFKSNSILESNFDFLIETKTPRLGWARCVRCPCIGFNDQTDQVDPSCTNCNGLGFVYFKPDDYVADAETIGTLTDEQQLVLGKANAVVIRGYMQGLSSQPNMFAALGNWALGSAMLTVRYDNFLGYYDRVIDLDGKRTHGEVVENDGTGTMKLRYPALAVNYLASLTTRFSLCTDENPTGEYQVVSGNIVWEAGKDPGAGIRIAVHYMHRPMWTVIEHVKLTRKSLVKAKKQRETLTTPAGDVLELPGQVLVRLEHLALDPG